MGIQRIAFFLVPVSDMTKARKFYEEVLNLHLDMSFDSNWIEYDVNGVTLALTTMPMDTFKPGQGGGVAFEVDDVDAMFERAVAAGCTVIEKPMNSPVCRMAVLCDPDGNNFGFHKCHANHPQLAGSAI